MGNPMEKQTTLKLGAHRDMWSLEFQNCVLVVSREGRCGSL